MNKKSISKTVGELVEELKQYDKNTRVLFAINQSAGFKDDYMDAYPIECVYSRTIEGCPEHEEIIDGMKVTVSKPPLCGYCIIENPELYYDEKEVVVLYCFP